MGTYTAFIVYSICNDLAPSFHCTNYQTQAKNIGNSSCVRTCSGLQTGCPKHHCPLALTQAMSQQNVLHNNSIMLGRGWLNGQQCALQTNHCTNQWIILANSLITQGTAIWFVQIDHNWRNILSTSHLHAEDQVGLTSSSKVDSQAVQC